MTIYSPIFFLPSLANEGTLIGGSKKEQFKAHQGLNLVIDGSYKESFHKGDL